MMTLDKARTEQKSRQKRSLFKFFSSLTFVIALFVILVLCTDVATAFAESNRKYMALVIAVPVLLIIAKFSGVTKFFHPKEFRGEVVNARVYSTKVSSTRYAGRGHGTHGEIRFAAEVTVKNEKGQSMTRTFWNGDVTSHLRPEDEIVILRFVDEPILIKGKYWSSSI